MADRGAKRLWKARAALDGKTPTFTFMCFMTCCKFKAL